MWGFFFRGFPIMAPAAEEATMQRKEITASAAVESVSGKGRRERQKMRNAVPTPERMPDKSPSPDSRTANIPPVKALKNRAHRERGLMMLSGSLTDAATAQKTRSRTSPAMITASCAFNTAAAMPIPLPF